MSNLPNQNKQNPQPASKAENDMPPVKAKQDMNANGKRPEANETQTKR